ncbi:MAG: metallophosphoesterase family protein [Agathobacter rectalis]
MPELDFSPGRYRGLIDIDGYKVLMCHGHTYGVKMSYMHLELHAKEVGADLALFGHTHKLFYDKHNGLAMMNPGSIGAPLWAACHHTVSSHLTKNTML